MIGNPKGLAAVLSMAATLIMVGQAEAQRGAARGRVVTEDKEPVADVEIVFEMVDGGRQFKTKSKESGEFARVGLSAGTYRVTFSKENYIDHVQPAQISVTEPNDLGDVILNPVPEGMITEKTREEAQSRLDQAIKASEGQDYQATIESLKKFLEIVPDSAEAHLNIASAYEKLKDTDNALAYYRKAIELKPDLYDAYVAMSDIYGARKEWKEGMAVLRKASELKPAELTVLYNYGAFAGNAGEPAEAERAFSQVLELKPDHALAHYQLGMVLVSQGKNEEAAAHMQKYVELEPEGPQAGTAKTILETLKKQ
jgi:Tfp pilus assembly protein PilF